MFLSFWCFSFITKYNFFSRCAFFVSTRMYITWFTKMLNEITVVNESSSPRTPKLTLLQEFATSVFLFLTKISPLAAKMRLRSFLNFKAWVHVALWRHEGTDPVRYCLPLQQIYFFRSSKKNFAHTPRWNSRIFWVYYAIFQCLGSQDFSNE